MNAIFKNLVASRTTLLEKGASVTVSRLKSAIYTLTVILVGGAKIFAQIGDAPEYGKLTELKDMHRVYVHSDDLDSRELIVTEIAKHSHLQVVGKIEDAEFFIFYGRSFFETGYSSFGGIFGGAFGTVTTKTGAEVGEYYVFTRGDKLESGSYRPRIIWGKQNLKVIRGNPFVKTRLPSKDVTKKFLKDFDKARTKKN
jgi:hypothetical protein